MFQAIKRPLQYIKDQSCLYKSGSRSLESFHVDSKRIQFQSFKFFSTEVAHEKKQDSTNVKAPFDLQKDKLRCTPEAFTALEAFHKKIRFPTPAERHKLGIELGLTRTCVRKFFFYKNVEFANLNPEEHRISKEAYQKQQKEKEERTKALMARKDEARRRSKKYNGTKNQS